MFELEVALQKLEDEGACDAERKARGKALDDIEAYEEEETGESKGRQHSHEVREAVMMFLALGIAPSKVLPALAVSKIDFNGRLPKLRWIQNMRKELRVVVCILAAATAADREVFPRAPIRELHAFSDTHLPSHSTNGLPSRTMGLKLATVKRSP